jgi:hypothetical protein
MTVRWFGDTAIVTGIYHLSEVKDGKTLVRHDALSTPGVDKDSGWVCVAPEATPIVHWQGASASSFPQVGNATPGAP